MTFVYFCGLLWKISMGQEQWTKMDQDPTRTSTKHPPHRPLSALFSKGFLLEFLELECLLASQMEPNTLAVLGQHAAAAKIGKRITMINSEVGNQLLALWQSNMAGGETHYKLAFQHLFQWENHLHMGAHVIMCFQVGGISYLTVPIPDPTHQNFPTQRHILAGQGPGVFSRAVALRKYETNSRTLTVPKKMCFAELPFTSLYKSARYQIIPLQHAATKCNSLYKVQGHYFTGGVASL